MSKALAIRCHTVRTCDLTTDFTDQAAVVLQRLVADGAALGWTEPPSRGEVADLLWEVVDDGPEESALTVAVGAGTTVADGRIMGLGYWRRYLRPTYRPHADLERVAVAAEFRRLGVARALVEHLIDRARVAGVEVLTLDLRGDNHAADRLYRSCGFVEYGRLPGFVAPDATQRHDRVLQALDLRPPAA